MCGIVGFVWAKNCNDRKELLFKALKSLAHRGPDHEGYWFSEDGKVWLGHRRLSILDLSPSGHQPMCLSDGRVLIIFNGEIYNFLDLRSELEKRGYRFQSRTDTEVLLAAYDAWGTDCLVRLQGMFAFALYDDRRKTLFLARDRAGEKPLFYRHDLTGFRFASELKALLADPMAPRKVHPPSLSCYLAMGYVPGHLCMLDGYKKLPPAHALLYDVETRGYQCWRYWQPPLFEQHLQRPEFDETCLLEELEFLLESAVRRQLVADVPVGILLSGGVDSSLITAMAVRASDRIRTFTVGFPGYGSFDETVHARLIAQHFGTEHNELMAEPSTAELVPMLAKQFDEPMNDSSMIPTYMVSRMIRRYCTVALGGDGGDELFGGYPRYSYLLQVDRIAGKIPVALRRAISTVGHRILPFGCIGRNWLDTFGSDLKAFVPMETRHFDRQFRNTLLPDLRDELDQAENIFLERSQRSGDLLRRATQMDFENYLPEDILVKVDRSSMINSLEIRAPFLDYRIIEFAFGKVPAWLKATVSERKIILKRLAHKVLPSKFDLNRKQGFSIPLKKWLKTGAFRALFEQVLFAEDCVFNRNAVKRLMKLQDMGFSNQERLFGLVIFELWRREYRIQLN